MQRKRNVAKIYKLLTKMLSHTFFSSYQQTSKSSYQRTRWIRTISIPRSVTKSYLLILRKVCLQSMNGLHLGVAQYLNPPNRVLWAHHLLQKMSNVRLLWLNNCTPETPSEDKLSFRNCQKSQAVKKMSSRPLLLMNWCGSTLRLGCVGLSAPL